MNSSRILAKLEGMVAAVKSIQSTSKGHYRQKHEVVSLTRIDLIRLGTVQRKTVGGR
jgi:hypothetical protein